MNLDRFAVGLRDAQTVTPRGYCASCGGEIYPGEDAWEVDGELLCDKKECLANYMEARRVSA